jgi:hypothetical protein
MRPRPLAAVVCLGLLAPLAACFSSGAGTPSSLLGDNSGRGPYGGGTAGSWSSSDAGTSSDAAATEVSPTDARSRLDGAATGGDGAAEACAAGATGMFAVGWTLGGADGGVATCAGVGGKTVAVDVLNLVTGASSTKTVACDALSATTCGLPRGSYQVTLGLRDAAGATLSEIVAPELVVENGQTVQVPALPFEVGATMGRGFALSWTLDRAATGAALTCAQAAAEKVRLEAGAKTFDLPCAPGSGRTPALAPGEYPVKLSLLGAQDAPLSVTGTMLIQVKAGQLLFLGAAVFDVN